MALVFFFFVTKIYCCLQMPHDEPVATWSAISKEAKSLLHLNVIASVSSSHASGFRSKRGTKGDTTKNWKLRETHHVCILNFWHISVSWVLMSMQLSKTMSGQNFRFTHILMEKHLPRLVTWLNTLSLLMIRPPWRRIQSLNAPTIVMKYQITLRMQYPSF